MESYALCTQTNKYVNKNLTNNLMLLAMRTMQCCGDLQIRGLPGCCVRHFTGFFACWFKISDRIRIKQSPNLGQVYPGKWYTKLLSVSLLYLENIKSVETTRVAYVAIMLRQLNLGEVRQYGNWSTVCSTAQLLNCFTQSSTLRWQHVRENSSPLCCKDNSTLLKLLNLERGCSSVELSVQHCGDSKWGRTAHPYVVRTIQLCWNWTT